MYTSVRSSNGNNEELAMRFAEDKTFARLDPHELVFFCRLWSLCGNAKNYQQQKLLHLATVFKRNEF